MLDVADISDIIHSFNHDKSSSISESIIGKSRNLQELFKYFNGTTASAFNVLSAGVRPIIFALYLKHLLVIVLLLFILLLALSFSFSPSFTSCL